MAVITYFDLELHHKDVKTTFLNGDLEEIYINQPKDFYNDTNRALVL